MIPTELAQIRRTLKLDPHAYSETIRAIAQGSSLETGDFLAKENVSFYNLMMWDVMIEMAINWRKGRKLNPEDYYDSNPVMYRKTHPKFNATSRNGHFVGRDFLTNQPIFRKY
ncbi:Uncharacterised protein [uncultured archaeon]|nr:Uncharacterised protein [uncultured archaeon]